MFGPLLERPVIHRDFQHKYPVLLSMFDDELNAAKQIFDTQKALAESPSGPVVNRNMPHVAGMMRWCRELRERVQRSMSKMKTVNHGTMESAEAMMVFSKYDEMMNIIDK